jgi:spermidine/putrescine transport system ATP-binding protein
VVSTVEDGRAVIVPGPGERIIVPLRQGSVTPGHDLELSVRPEKIDLSTAAPSNGDGSVVRGVVTEVVYMGTSTNYTVRTSTGVDVAVFDQNASSAEDVAVRGDDVFLSWRPQHSYPIGDR